MSRANCALHSNHARNSNRKYAELQFKEISNERPMRQCVANSNLLHQQALRVFINVIA